MKVIVFEGIDASGKETQVELLKRYLEVKGFKVRTDAFPRYDTPQGALIGRILRGEESMEPRRFHLLYELDRLKYQETLNRYINSGVDYVIIDRYYLSNLAYMMANELSIKGFTDIFKVLMQPDITIYLDITADTSFKRRVNRNDLFEKDKEFLTKVTKSYTQINDKLDLMYCIDTNDLTPLATHERVIRKLVNDRLI